MFIKSISLSYIWEMFNEAVPRFSNQNSTDDVQENGEKAIRPKLNINKKADDKGKY